MNRNLVSITQYLSIAQLDSIFRLRYTDSMVKRAQKIHSYFAVFDPAVEGGYDISFPDFPGCVTFGKTFEEAKRKAAEVLELWIEELNSQKQPIPRRVLRPIIDEIEVATR